MIILEVHDARDGQDFSCLSLFLDTLNLARAERGCEIKNGRSQLVVVYLRPSTVSITVTSKVLLDVPDVLVVLDVVAGVGAGAGAPLVGISPARTGTDISPVRAIANTKCFIVESPLSDDATVLVSEMTKRDIMQEILQP